MSKFSGTSMPVASKVKDLKGDLKAHEYDETGSNPKKVTRTIVENHGRKVGEFVKVGKDIAETYADPDVKKAGIKLDKECLPTAPSDVAEPMDQNGTDEIEKAKMLKKTAAPMNFSFKNTLEKVQKFRKALPTFAQDLNKAILPNDHVYHATVRDKKGNVLHSGHYPGAYAVQKMRERFEKERHKYGDTNVELALVPDPKKAKKSEVNSLEKAGEKPPSNISRTQFDTSPGLTNDPYRGEITDQMKKEKMLGVTKRLRNQMQGKFGVVQGGKQEPPPSPPKLMSPGELLDNKKKVAAEQNKRVNINQYRKDPKSLVNEARKNRVNQSDLKSISPDKMSDWDYNFAVKRQQNAEGKPTQEESKAGAGKLKVIQGEKQPVSSAESELDRKIAEQRRIGKNLDQMRNDIRNN